ncbi:helix-turn-helix transcriptional regulator [Steroidobacter sp.]|uniref:helix-turn-helix transcriptional regulator n=1 Tax=Steroidobacter sp. TaxID=1978227 RepID=UPI001A415483|nr:AraC family transcriptional regulator [Steroidobacter sp.]MBL8266955.1 helix-turn-helix transcriptional regulator [Steroidobacter sp.]
MTESLLALSPEELLPTLAVPGTGVPEVLEFGNRLSLSIDQYRLSQRYDGLIYGTDMIKFHVRLAGRRSLTFDGYDMLALDDTATAVLLHDRDLPKTDHILADHDEVSITVAMDRARFLEYLDAGNTDVPVALEDVISRYAYSPRLATAVPTPDEIRLAREILGCRRTGPLRKMFLEAKALEFVHIVLEHLVSPAEARASSVRLTDRDKRRLHEVRERLEATFMEGARIEDLAREFGLNRNKLCTGFRSLFGVSIFDFASGLRMSEARRLLRESRLSVSEVALSVGYSSTGAFSSAFHRCFGHSPSEARGLIV